MKNRNQSKSLTLAAVGLAVGFFTRANLWAQGTVSFSNVSVPTSYPATNWATRQRVPAGTRFLAALYYAPDTGGRAPSECSFIQLGAPVGFSSPGFFNGGTRTTPPSAAPGGPAWFQVRIWDSNDGATLEEAAAVNKGYFIVSTVVRVRQTGDSTASPPTPAASLTANGLRFPMPPIGFPSLVCPDFNVRPSGPNVTLAWGLDGGPFGGANLISSPRLGPGAVWTVVTNRPSTNGHIVSVTLHATNANRFFRRRLL